VVDRFASNDPATSVESAPVPEQSVEMIDAWIGLGSNVGDRLAFLRQACSWLARVPGIDVVAASSVYETEPWGYLDQARFLNAVVRIRTFLGPIQLLVALKVIEQELGRTHVVHWGPREIDLDIVQYGQKAIKRRGLTSPHAEVARRAFVLVPLREVSPDFRSANGPTVEDLLAKLEPNATAMRAILPPAALFVR
jgi:2-amino-4-hydroxy-6-hydroxymethyldihydropteridine diphosphokinase